MAPRTAAHESIVSSAPAHEGLFSRLSLEDARAQSEASGLLRALGPVSLTGVGIAAMIGAGIFFLLGQEARGTGPAVVVSLLIAGAATALAALAYAEFASLVPGSGSAYAYAYTGFGRLPAFLMGWLILNGYAIGNAAVAIGWSAFLAVALERLGVSLDEALLGGPSSGGLLNLPAALIMALITGLTLLRVRQSVLVNNALVALKIVIVLFVILFGLQFVRAENYATFSPGGSPAVVGSAAVLFFAYLGFDVVAATGEEARRPRRDLPLGILASVAVATLLYIAMAAVVTGMMPQGAVASSDAVVAVAFADRGYAWAADIITLGALVALATVLYAFHLGLSRILFAMARDGFLPERWSRLHPRTSVPWEVTLWAGAFTVLAAAFLPLEQVVDTAVLAMIVIYILVAAGVLALKRLRPDAPRSFRVHWSVPAAAVLLLAYLGVVGIAPLIHAVTLAWVGLGLVLYGFYAHRSSLRAARRRGAIS